MQKKLPPDNERLLQKLRLLVDGMEVPPAGSKIKIFDEKEVNKIRDMIAIYDALSGLGRIGNWLMGVLKWFAFMFAIFAAWKLGVEDWIRGVK